MLALRSSRYLFGARRCFCTGSEPVNAGKMSDRSLRNGEALPPVNRDLMRIYSMRFCPFAQRTRIVLLHKKIPHETVNVNLRYKPDWFLARNPLGLVPVLEHEDRVVYESIICDDYLERVYPNSGMGRLTPDCPHQRARDEMLMRFFDAKIPASIYGLRKPERAEKARASMTMGLTKLEEALGNEKFFGGNKPSMVDYHVYPWFERFPAMKELSTMSGEPYDPLPPTTYPALSRWVARIQAVPAVRDTMLSKNLHMQFQMSFAQRAPEYDFGLENATAKL